MTQTAPTSDRTFNPSLPLDEMRDKHVELLKRQRLIIDSSDEAIGNIAFVDDVVQFIERAIRTGALLESDRERQEAQTLIDYWSARLIRTQRDLGDTTLDNFDETQVPELPNTPCPYQGLAAFRENDKAYFFGREMLVDRILARLGSGQSLLTIVGASGSGKSSLVLAGLIPKLKQGILPGSDSWRYVTLVPGADPLNNLIRELSKSAGHATRTVLVIDQFEEMFTLCTDDILQRKFAEQILSIIEAPENIVILTMRADFVDSVARLPNLWPQFRDARIDVEALDINELRAAIEKPAALVGLKFDEGIVDDLITTILGERAGLPLLQFTLLKLWEQRRRNRITQDVYHVVGNPREALERSAEAFYAAQIPENQAAIKRILLKMVRPTEGLEFTSNRVPRRSLFEGNAPHLQTTLMLDQLIHKARLVKETPGVTEAETQVEIAHEALVRNWPRLVRWLEGERESLLQRRLLTETARRWTNDNDSSLLLRGRALEIAESLTDLTSDEQAFVQASRAQAEIEIEMRNEARLRVMQLAYERKVSQRLRILVTALIALSLITAGLAGWAIFQTRKAEAAEATAKAEEAMSRSRELATTVILQTSRGEDPVLAVLLAIEADKAAPTVESQVALQQALFAPRVYATLEGHTDAPVSVMYSPDGKFLVTAGLDKTARVWNVNDGKQVQLFPHESIVWHAAFSPDGKRIVTAGNDGIARVWDVKTGAESFNFPGQFTFNTRNAAFSPNSKWIVSASQGQTIHIHDAQTGDLIKELTGLAAPVKSVAFSSDSSRVLSASTDGSAIVWDANTGNELFRHEGGNQPIVGADFSQDGRYMATVGDDHIMRIWDLPTKELRVSHVVPEGRTINNLSFSPDGRQVAVSSDDRMVHIWDIETGHLTSLSGHASGVLSAAFSPKDSERIASTSYDYSIRIWDTKTGKDRASLFGHTSYVKNAQYSPDGLRILTASLDGTARMWDTKTRRELLRLAHNGPVDDATFSSNGKAVLTASRDQTARVWDAVTGAVLSVFTHTVPIYSARYSPLGDRIVTGAGDGTTWIWDVAEGKVSLVLKGHQGQVNDARFSPDSRFVATAGADQKAVVWDAVSGKVLWELLGHKGWVNSAAYSPDGSRIVTASEDGTVRVWDATSGKQLSQIDGHFNAVFDAVYSSDGRQILTASRDNTARIWDAATQEELFRIVGHAASVYSAQYAPDGRHVVTTSDDQTAIVHAITLEDLRIAAQERAIRPLSCRENVRYLHVKAECQ